MTPPVATPRPVMDPRDSFWFGFVVTAAFIAGVVLLVRRVIG